jgi:predicted RNA-binding protein with PIN domain
MLIIIDGYNFIFNVPALEKHVKINRIEHVRDFIVYLFSKYKEKKRYDIIIVFDGNFTKAVLPKKQVHSGIEVIFSKSGISADTEIKNITSLCQNPKDVRIVTYDNDIIKHVKKCGCQIIEPNALYKDILATLDTAKKQKADEPESKHNGPSEADAKYWKDIFKNLPNKESETVTQKIEMPATKIKQKSPKTKDEPPCKYFGPSADEAQYWIRIFQEGKKNETKN